MRISYVQICFDVKIYSQCLKPLSTVRSLNILSLIQALSCRDCLWTVESESHTVNSILQILQLQSHLPTVWTPGLRYLLQSLCSKVLLIASSNHYKLPSYESLLQPPSQAHALQQPKPLILTYNLTFAELSLFFEGQGNDREGRPIIGAYRPGERRSKALKIR